MADESIPEFQPGDKVQFAYPDRGWPHDREIWLHHLCLGCTYTVRAVEVGHWTSYVSLEEVPNQQFNTVQFTRVP